MITRDATTSNGNLYFDKDGNRSYGDQILVAIIGIHPNGGAEVKFDADQILILPNFDLV
jgi:hypothetical protein